MKFTRTDRKGVTLLHRHHSAGIHTTRELREHPCGFGRAYNPTRMICGHESLDSGRMVRFEMLHNQEVGLPTATRPQKSGQRLKPSRLHRMVNRVHHDQFFILYYIGVVTHPVGKRVLLLKQSDSIVYAAEPSDTSVAFSHMRPMDFHRSRSGLLLAMIHLCRFLSCFYR